ncbi:MAG TPA: glycosyltransferase family 4 protein [Pyrinomonadaceae bacterium]|jgi:glycosyltransferase involved in cell wall biosynthesis
MSHTRAAAGRRAEDAAGRAESAAPPPVRVLIVGPSLDILGGQAVQAARLLERLREVPSLEVSFLPVNPRLPGALRRLQAIKYVRTLLTSLLYAATLLARVRRYDVIHIFSASYFSFVLAPTPAILVARLFRKKIVLNYHSGEALDHLTRWRRTALPTIRLADRVVVPSNYLVDVFARFGVAAQPIYNFVELGQFRFRARRGARAVFLSNRNFEAHYNVGCVLEAFALIQRQVPGARLLVAGDGAQRAALAERARDLKLQHVEFLGLVSPEEMPRLYEAADVFLNASEIDNMPLSIIEAYAAGLPVVTTDAGGIPYMVSDGETGLLVPRGDCAALADKALLLLRDEGLATALAERALAECRKYTWAEVGREWIELYEEAGAGSLSRAPRVGRGREIPLSEH